MIESHTLFPILLREMLKTSLYALPIAPVVIPTIAHKTPQNECTSQLEDCFIQMIAIQQIYRSEIYTAISTCETYFNNELNNLRSVNTFIDKPQITEKESCEDNVLMETINKEPPEVVPTVKEKKKNPKKRNIETIYVDDESSSATEDKPIEEKPTAEKPTEEKPTADKPTEDKPIEDKQTEGKEKSSKSKKSNPNKKQKRKRRSNLPKKSVQVLKRWLIENVAKPYPNEEQKNMLCESTGLGNAQLCNWFINARRRIIKPLTVAEEQKKYNKVVVDSIDPSKVEKRLSKNILENNK